MATQDIIDQIINIDKQPLSVRYLSYNSNITLKQSKLELEKYIKSNKNLHILYTCIGFINNALFVKIIHSSLLNETKKLYTSEPIIDIYAITPTEDNNIIDNDLIDRLIESISNIEINQNIKLYNSKIENNLSKYNEIKCNYNKLDRGFKPKEIKDTIDISYTPTFKSNTNATTNSNTAAKATTVVAPSKPATKVAPVNASKQVTSFFGKNDSSKTVEVAAPKLQNLTTSNLAASFFDNPTATKTVVEPVKPVKPVAKEVKTAKTKSPAKHSKASAKKSKVVQSDEDMDDDIVFTTSKSAPKPAPKKSAAIVDADFESDTEVLKVIADSDDDEEVIGAPSTGPKKKAVIEEDEEVDSALSNRKKQAKKRKTAEHIANDAVEEVLSDNEPSKPRKKRGSLDEHEAQERDRKFFSGHGDAPVSTSPAKTCRVQVTESFVDENGYFVTEKVWKDVPMDELTEEQLAKENSVKTNVPAPAISKPSEKKLSEPKKATVKKVGLGQGTLNSFFSKS